MSVKYPNVTVELVGSDGNAFAVLGAVTKAMKRAGVAGADIVAYKKEAMSDDYDHLLQTTMKTVNVE
jgi:hypothetical protein